ncbi:MAG: hypothetical protein KAV87_41945, partial [Desulfobacteraceae bacterium]|nr:hypothetical protein [Desulfobacteraceae bacterium]
LKTPGSAGHPLHLAPCTARGFLVSTLVIGGNPCLPRRSVTKTGTPTHPKTQITSPTRQCGGKCRSACGGQHANLKNVSPPP